MYFIHLSQNYIQRGDYIIDVHKLSTYKTVRYYVNLIKYEVVEIFF